MLRDQQAVRTRPSPGTCGSAPAPTTRRTTCPQEYIDKYKGKFDDGYEAYREWVLPRMIEKGILPEDTAAHADQPDAGDVARRTGDAVRPWDTLNADEKKLFAAWPRSTPASPSTPTPRSGASSTTWRRPGSSTTRSSSTAPTTAPPARAARTARSTRTSSSTAIPDDLAENMEYLDELGSPDTYNHYPTGWAVAFSHAVPDVQALLAVLRAAPAIRW